MSKIAGENKSRNKKVKIMVFGTFDGVHLGHLNFFKQARSLSPKAELIVSVARDRNVFRIKRKKPELNEKKRAGLLKKVKLVNRVVLGGVENHLNHIKKESPDIIALGYDQKAYVKNLKNDLKKMGLQTKIIRLRSYKPRIYKNSIIKRSIYRSS